MISDTSLARPATAAILSLVTSASLPGASLCEPRTSTPRVWVVSTTAGTGVDHRRIEDAVAVAAFGDVVLVRAGEYSGFTIDARSATIVADGAVRVVGSVVVRNSTASQRVLLCGLQVLSGGGASASSPLRIEGCDGLVWVERCTLAGADGSNVPPDVHAAIHGVEIVGCASVSLVRCTVDGGVGADYGGLAGQSAPGGGAPAVFAALSSLHVLDCDVSGGGGGTDLVRGGNAGGAGGEALLLEDGFTFVASSRITGGAGGDGSCHPTQGCGDGGRGGTGIFGGGVGPHIEIYGNEYEPGLGGTGGTPGAHGWPYMTYTGMIGQITGLPRTLEVGAPIREGQVLPLLARGAPGDDLFLLASPDPLVLWLPQYRGALFPAPPFRRLALGSVPVTGVLRAGLPLEALETRVEGRVWFLQVGVIDGSGQRFVGAPALFVALDGDQ